MKIDIIRQAATGADSARLGGRLSALALQQGAVAYAPQKHVFKASVAGRVLGEAIVKENWGMIEIQLIYVEEDARRKGVGTALMKSIEAFARSVGSATIRLHTAAWEGVGFYERFGYQEISRFPMNIVIGGQRQEEISYFKSLLSNG